MTKSPFPIILAWRLWKADALRDFDPFPMVRSAAAFLIRQGPVTQQERWEEASGYSPSTLAATITALICAADLAQSRGQGECADFLEDYADFLESHLERWTVTTDGTLVPGITRHYIRIHPSRVDDHSPEEYPDGAKLAIANRPPGAQWQFPAKEVVDAGFLELVRYGIRKPGDSLIEDSLRVVDTKLKIETPFGPCWRRYKHDGYGIVLTAVLSRDGGRAGMATPQGGTRALRTCCRTRREALHTSYGGLRFERRHASRTGL